MAGKKRELTLVILGDADQLDRTFAKVGKGADRVGDKADKMGKRFGAGMKVAGAAAAGAMVVGLKQATSAAIEAEKSQVRMETQLNASNLSYRAHAKEIEAVIQKTSKLAGLDDEDLQDAFTAIVRATGDVNKALGGTALAADVARGSQKELATVASAVAKAHAGNGTALARLAGINAKGKESTDILAEAQRKFAGQAEEYGKTTAGATDRAAIGWENLNEVVGARLAPTLAKIADKLADLSNWAAANPGKFKAIAITIAAVGTAVGGLIIVSRVAAGIRALRAAVLLLNTAFLTNPAVLIVAGLVALGVALVVAYKKSETFRRIVDGAFKVVKTVAVGALKLLIGALDRLTGMWSSMLGVLGHIPGFGWAKKAQKAIDEARAATRAWVKSLDDLPKEKNVKVKVSVDVVDVARRSIRGALEGAIERAGGGMIPGVGDKDTVPIWATPGEHMTRKAIVQKFGPTVFADINEGRLDPRKGYQRFTSGGIISRAENIAGKYPYVWGGGHGRTGVPSGGPRAKDAGQVGYDCSGAVSAAIGVSPPRVSGAFTSWGKPGPGSPNDTKVYANAEHVFAVFNGRGWGTGSPQAPDGGAGWLPYNHRSGFTIRHLEDGAQKGKSTTGNDEERSVSGASSTGPTKTERAERAGSRLVNKITAPFAGSFRSSVASASTLGSAIEDAGTTYGQAERAFGQTDENLGTAAGRSARVSEIGELVKLKKKTLERQEKRAAALRKAIANREALLKKLRAARDKAKGAKRAKINERIRPIVDRLDDYKAEMKALGFEIRDTELDIGDLANEAGNVAGTADEAGPTATDKLGEQLGDIDLQERAGIISPTQATGLRQQYLRAALSGAYGALDDRQKWEVMAQLRDAQQAATDAQNQATQAASDLAASIDALKAEVAKQNAIAESVVGISLREAQRALADVISGEITGRGVAPRRGNAGSGAMARY